MATKTGGGEMRFPASGAVVERADFDDGTTTWTITPGPQGQMPPGYPEAFPGATVNPAP